MAVTNEDPIIIPKTANSIEFDGVHINLSALARATGIDKSYLSRMFAGKVSPNLFFAETVSTAIGFTLDRFTQSLKTHSGDVANHKSRASRKGLNRLAS